jgi:hypothetical protein
MRERALSSNAPNEQIKIGCLWLNEEMTERAFRLRADVLTNCGSPNLLLIKLNILKMFKLKRMSL